MKLTQTLENGYRTFSMDGETGKEVSREVPLFPGQTAMVTLISYGDYAELKVSASRNGTYLWWENRTQRSANTLSGAFDKLPNELQKMSDALKLIPLKQIKEIEF